MQKFGLNCEEKLAFSLAKGHLKLPQLWKTNPCMLFLDWPLKRIDKSAKKGRLAFSESQQQLVKFGE